MKNKTLDIVIKEGLNSDDNLNWNSDVNWKQFQQKNRTKPFIIKILTLASAAVIILIFGFVFFNPSVQHKAAFANLQSGNDEIKTFRLSDKDEIWINKKTLLLVGEKDVKRFYDFYLEGEAWFDIKKPIDKDFKLLTGNVSIQFSSGAFNLKAYTNNREITLTVVKGTVQVCDINNAGLAMLVNEGQTCVILRDNNLITTSAIENQNFLAWKTKSLEFDETPLFLVVQALNDLYNSKIEFDNEDTETCELSGKFTNQSLESILKEINNTFKTKTIKKQEKIIITGKGC